jgi:hypothetical protein
VCRRGVCYLEYTKKDHFNAMAYRVGGVGKVQGDGRVFNEPLRPSQAPVSLAYLAGPGYGSSVWVSNPVS